MAQKALLVGINNYPEKENTLYGCVNDITDMANFLVDKCSFKEDEVRLISDGRATTKAILDRLNWLLSGLKSGDRILFHYSGHGAQLPMRGHTGLVDKNCECICPYDFDWSSEHAIKDTDFMDLFSKIPSGVEFVWISDSCHSGGLVDTRAIHNPVIHPKRILPPADINWRTRTADTNSISALSFREVSKKIGAALIAACKADQTAADASFNNRPNGALTYFLLKDLNDASLGKQPLQSIVTSVTTALKKNKYEQIPQLEGNDEIKQKAFLKV